MAYWNTVKHLFCYIKGMMDYGISYAPDLWSSKLFMLQKSHGWMRAVNGSYSCCQEIDTSLNLSILFSLLLLLMLCISLFRSSLRSPQSFTLCWFCSSSVEFLLGQSLYAFLFGTLTNQCPLSFYGSVLPLIGPFHHLFHFINAIHS